MTPGPELLIPAMGSRMERLACLGMENMGHMKVVLVAGEPESRGNEG
jgi:hypothetical protein